MLYLVHETAAGYPIGVFSPGGDSYYDPRYADAHEAYGQSIAKSRVSGTWEDWVNTLDARLPNHRAQWIGVNLKGQPLADVLQQLQNNYDQVDNIS